MGASWANIGPVELIVFVTVFVVLAAAFLLPQSPPRRRHRARWQGYAHRKRWAAPPSPGPQWRPEGQSDFARLVALPDAPANPTDPAEQLRAVMAGSFTARRVLSRTEAQVMRATEAAIAEAGLTWRVLAQVSLGEVLASPDKAAFNAINAKRVDLLIVSAISEPLAAIEYQGEGHWQGSAPARDAVKKEALRKAGIGYIEVTPAHGPDDLRREIARIAVTQGAARPRILAGSDRTAR